MEVSMKLSAEAKNAIESMRPCLVATADKTGKPNVSAKGSIRVLDDEHVTFADVNSPRTVKNIRQNPQVAIICIDAAAHKSCRLWGTGEIISAGPLYDKVVEALASISKGRKINNVVKVTISEIELS
jgi:uncharacterized protein